MGQILGVQAPTASVLKSNKSIFILLGVFIVVAAIAAYLLMLKGILKSPFSSKAKAPTVELKTEYSNPFNPTSQYVNPFQENKNQFRNL